MWETWFQSLGWKDLLEKEMATHSSFLSWIIPLDRGAWLAIVHGVAESLRHDWNDLAQHGDEEDPHDLTSILHHLATEL